MNPRLLLARAAFACLESDSSGAEPPNEEKLVSVATAVIGHEGGVIATPGETGFNLKPEPDTLTPALRPRLQFAAAVDAHLAGERKRAGTLVDLVLKTDPGHVEARRLRAALDAPPRVAAPVTPPPAPATAAPSTPTSAPPQTPAVTGPQPAVTGRVVGAT